MSRLSYVLISILVGLGNVAGQSVQFADDLLPAVRHAAGLIPGALPDAVNVQRLWSIDAPATWLVEGTGAEWEGAVHSTYQIRYPDSWIMVDVPGGPNLPGESGRVDESYRQFIDALLGARLIITTHEHHDHLWGLIQGPHAEMLAQKAILTREQIHTLVTAPNRPEVKLTEPQAGRFLSVGYDRIFPVAPGVVLIKAPGHTRGGQLIYVRCNSGKEIILSGDVAWQKIGIDRGMQKPLEISSQLGEDREAIAPELTWLRTVEGMGVAVVVFHDLAAIEKLIDRGILGDRVDLR